MAKHYLKKDSGQAGMTAGGGNMRESAWARPPFAKTKMYLCYPADPKGGQSPFYQRPVAASTGIEGVENGLSPADGRVSHESPWPPVSRGGGHGPGDRGIRGLWG